MAVLGNTWQYMAIHGMVIYMVIYMVIHSNTWHVHGYTWQYMAIISDISDHFSQFCILKSIRDKIKIKKVESAGLF